MIVRRGLPDGLRPDAARLYWEAFGAKLGPVLGPEPRALHFFERVIRADHCIVALDDLGRLIGLAGFKTPEGSFAGGTRRDLRRTYGIVGAGWRGLLLWALSRDIDNARFLIDRICDEGLRLGYRSVRLDVVDTNGRARALYERLGFVAVRTEKIGPLRHVFGFSAATTMVRPIG